MGLPLCERIRCCVDKSHVTTRFSKSVVTMLRYNNSSETKTFSDLVRHSIRHERKVRGWCEKCKKYQMQRHVRSLLTPDLSQKKDMSRMLPPMISFTCSTWEGKPDEKDVVETFWRGKSSRVRGVRARSARILIISLEYYEQHCITHSYHCTLEYCES